jgi:hypothetical protein
MSKKMLLKLLPYVGFLIMILVLIYRINQNKYEQRVLKSSLRTTAIIVKIEKVAVRDPASGTFLYKIGKRQYKFEETGDFTFMEVGDTIEIEYSKKDFSIARVIDKYYMQKYWKFKKDNKDDTVLINIL